MKTEKLISLADKVVTRIGADLTKHAELSVKREGLQDAFTIAAESENTATKYSDAVDKARRLALADDDQWAAFWYEVVLEDLDRETEDAYEKAYHLANKLDRLDDQMSEIENRIDLAWNDIRP